MNTRILFTLLISAWSFSGIAFAQESNLEIVEGVSTEQIDEIFALYQSDSEPGCSVSIFQEGESIFSNSYGLSNLDYGIALSDTSAFYMASISKHVTAASAGLLVLRDQLDENAFVNEYIEDWPEYASEVRIRHLFNHTSGLPDIYGLMDIAGISLGNVMDMEDYMDVIRRGESLKFEPGSDYSYTNSGYTTLAYLIEQITEMNFSEFVHVEFFEPFGMKSSHFHDNRMKVIPNRVISYAPGEESFRRTYNGNFQGVGPGGLYSTLSDWEIWETFWDGNLQWTGGISTEEADQLKQRMTTPTATQNEDLDYGWGLHIQRRKGSEMIGHGGSFMGFKTDYRRYPEHRYSFLTLCNRMDANPERLNHEMADLFLKDHFEAFLRPFEGVYRNEELPIDYTLKVEDGKLILDRKLSPRDEMAEGGDDTWRAGSWEFVFNRNENGSIGGFTVSTGRAKDVEFKKLIE